MRSGEGSMTLEDLMEMFDKILWEVQIEDLLRQLSRLNDTREERVRRGEKEFESGHRGMVS